MPTKNTTNGNREKAHSQRRHQKLSAYYTTDTGT